MTNVYLLPFKTAPVIGNRSIIFRVATFCIAIVFACFSAKAQSPQYFMSGDFAAPNSWANTSTMTASAGGTFIHTTTANAVANSYFRFYSGANGAGINYGPSPSTAIPLSTATALSNTGNGADAYYITPLNTTNNIVFKTDNTPRTAIFEVQGAIQTVTGVSQSPTANAVQQGQAVTVTATISGAFATGQSVYIRYTNNGYAASVVTEMTGSGTTYTTTIPGAYNTAGAPVSYYIFTSGNGLTIAGADADLYTINLNNNATANYNYTVLTLGAIYLHDFGVAAINTASYAVAPGTLNGNLSASTWVNNTGGNFSNLGGSVGQALSVQAGLAATRTYTLTFNVAATHQASITSFNFWTRASGAGPTNWSMTINGIAVGAGVTSGSGAAIGNTAVSTPVNNQTGTITVVLTLTGGSSNLATFRLDDFELDGYVFALNPPVVTSFTVAAPGAYPSGYVGNTITVSGSGFLGTSSIKMGGSGGTAVSPFTVVNDNTITFPAINAGGTIYVANGAGNSTSAASYTNLGYISNASTAWGTGTTWLGGAVPVAGSTVTIAHDVTVNTAVGTAPSSITINGTKSLTFATSGTLTTTTLTNGGTLAASGTGTLTIAAGGTITNNGTYNWANGTINFAGATTINGTNSYTFNNVIVNTGNATLGVDATVSGTLTLTGGSFRINGNTLTLNGPVSSAAGTIGAPAGSDLVIGGTGAINSIAFTAGSQSLTQLLITRPAASSTVPITSALSVSSLASGISGNSTLITSGAFTNTGTFTVAAGSNFTTSATVTNNGTMNISGTFQIDNGGFGGGTTDFVYTAGSTLIYNYTQSTTYGPVDAGHRYFPAVNPPTNLILQQTGTGALQMGKNITITGALTFQNAGTKTFDLNNNSFTCGSTTVNGTAVIQLGTLNFVTGSLTANASTSILGPADVYVNGATNITAGTFTLSTTVASDLYVKGNFTQNATLTHNNRTIFFVGTAGLQTISGSGLNGTGATNCFYDLRLDNTSDVGLGTNINVTNSMTFTNGKLILNAFNLTSTSNIATPSAIKYVQTNSTGQLKIPVGAGAVTFPVGNAAYNPLILNNTGGTADTYGVRVLDVTTTPAANNPNKIINRYWAITEAAAGGTNLAVTGQWNSPGEEAVNFAAGTTPKIGLYTTVWSEVGASQVGSTLVSAAVLTASNITAGATLALGKDDAFICPTAPALTGISTAAPYYPGDNITVTGTNLTGLVSATINGVTATIGTQSGTSVILTVPTGITSVSGVVSIVGACGPAVTTAFTFAGNITISGGSWSNPAIWRGGGVPGNNTPVTIDNGHIVTQDVSADPSTLTINPAASLTNNTNSIVLGATNLTTTSISGTLTIGINCVTVPSYKSTTVTVTGTGTFTNNAGIATAVNVTTFTVQNSGTYNHGAVGSSTVGASTDFPGTTRTFGATSNVVVTKWANGGAPAGTLPNNMGNVTINIATLAGNWNLASNVTTINGNLQVQATGGRTFLFTTSAANVSVLGSVSLSGASTVVLTAGGSGNFNITGGLSISGSADLNSTSYTIHFVSPGTGNFDYTTSATGTIRNIYVDAGRTCDFTGNSPLTIGNTATLIIDGTTTINNTGTAPGVKVNGGLTTVNGTLTVQENFRPNASITISSGATINFVGEKYVDGGGAFTLSSGATIGITSVDGINAATLGNVRTTTKSFNSGATYIYQGPSAQNSGVFTLTTASAMLNLVINNTNGVTLQQLLNISTSGNVNLQNGQLKLAGFDLTLANNATFSGAPFSGTKMIVINGAGYLKRSVLSGQVLSSYLWPIGETTNYSPVTLTGTSSIAGTVGFRVIDGIHPSMSPASNYISRYWDATYNNPVMSSGMVITAAYIASDITGGAESTMRNSIWVPSLNGWDTDPTAAPGSPTALTITQTLSNNSLTLGTGAQITARANTPVYYRSLTTGNWGNAATWETSLFSNFSSILSSPATTPPNYLNSIGILIRSTHTVTVENTVNPSPSLVVDQLTVDGILTINSTSSFTLANGTGTDLSITATTGRLNLTAATAVTFAGSTATVVDGYVRNAINTFTSSGTLTFNGTSTYEHAYDGGTVPAATWNGSGATGALMKMTGMNGTSSVGGLGQTFYHVEFANTNQNTASLQILGDFNTINGDLTMSASGSSTPRQVRLFANIGTNVYTTLTINRNLVVTGGTLGIVNSGANGSANCTIRVKGSVTVSGGTLDMTGSSPNTGGGSNLEIEGDLTVSGAGTIIRSQNTPSTITFLKTTSTPVQTFSSTAGGVSTSNIGWFVGASSGATNTVQMATNWAINTSSTLTVRSGATLDVLAELIVSGGTFSADNGGTVKIGSRDGITTGAAGNIRTTTRTYTPGCNFTYASLIENQATGNGLPTTITGALTIANAGPAGNKTVTLTTTGTSTLTLNLNAGLFAAGTGQQLNITNTGTINGNGGDFATGTTSGVINFPAPGTGYFTGNSNPYNVYASGGVDFGSGTVTIQNGGTFRINSGGFVTGNSPFYASGSILQYYSTGTYNRSLEWNATTGRAYPATVRISNNTTLDLGANGNTTARACADSLIIDAGSSLTMNNGGNTMNVAASPALTIGKNFTINGNLTFSSNNANDIAVGGNWTHAASGANINFNNRAVFFNGTGTQLISKVGGGTEDFDGTGGKGYFVINKTAGNVQLNSSPATNVSMSNATSGGNVIQLLNTGGLDLNGQTFTYAGNGADNSFLKVSGGVRNIFSSVAGGIFSITYNDIANASLVVTSTSGGTLVFGNNLTVLLAGGINFGSNLTTINHILQINQYGYVKGNSPTYGNASTLIYNNTDHFKRSMEWTAASNPGFPNDVIVQNNTTLVPQGGSGVTASTIFNTRGNVTITAGSAIKMDSILDMQVPLRVGGNLTIAGILNTSKYSPSLPDSLFGSIYVGGNWNRTGTFNDNNKAVTFDGTANATLTATGGQVFPFMYLSKNAKVQSLTLLDSVTITKEAGFTQGTFDLANKNVTIISNATVTARVAAITAVGNVDFPYSGTGRFFIQRYYPQKRTWRLVSAPVQAATAPTINAAWQEGANPPSVGLNGVGVSNPNPHPGFGLHITGPYNSVTAYNATTVTANGFDQSPQNISSMKYFTGGTAGTWAPVLSTLTNKVTYKQGFLLFVRGARDYQIDKTTNFATPANAVLRTIGKINVGPVPVPLTGTSFQVIGNPYPSAIRFGSNMLTNNTAVANSSYSLYDPLRGSKLNSPSNVGGFISVQFTPPNTYNSTYSPYTDVSSNPHPFDSSRIESGAAFLIDSKVSSGNFIVDENDKISGSTNLLFRPLDVVMPKLRANMYFLDGPNGTPQYWADGALNLFDDNFNTAVDWSQDVRKLLSSTENLSIRREGELISIEQRQPIGYSADTIFYDIRSMKLGNYRFDFIATDWNRPDLVGFVEDSYTGIRTPFNTNGITSVPFTITNVTGTWVSDRFRIVFIAAAGGPLPVRYTSVKAWQQNHDINVEWKVENELNIKEYEVERSTDGRNFTKVNTTIAKGNANSSLVYNWLDVHPVTGVNYYRIRSIDQNNSAKYSQVVKVVIGKGTPGIAIYPNPVKGGVIGLQMTNMPAGKYQFRLINAIGQVLLTRPVDHADGSSSETIPFDKSIISGIYQLEIYHPDTTKTVLKIIVE